MPFLPQAVKNGMSSMIPTMENLRKLSDEELEALDKAVSPDGHWRNMNIANEIGRREALKRKPGDPGTKENPIIRNGKAYLYTKYNQLALWENWPG